MSDTERDANLEILRGTEAKLKAVLKEIPRAVVTWTPAPGKWSILEIVGHLRDMEKDAYLARYQRILSEEIPSLPDADGDKLSLENEYRSQKLSGLLREWSRLRRDSLRLLKKVRAADWNRAGIHETAGRLTTGGTDIDRCLEQGFRFIQCATELNFMTAGAQALLKEFGRRPEVAPPIAYTPAGKSSATP
jgi:hypothetical protein